MAQQFTPGPWTFKTDPITGDSGLRAHGTGVFVEAFADIRHAGEMARGEAIANARLISAAPDLLAAAKEQVRHWDEREAELGRLGPGAVRCRDLFRAVIAKAEGIPS